MEYSFEERFFYTPKLKITLCKTVYVVPNHLSKVIEFSTNIKGEFSGRKYRGIEGLQYLKKELIAKYGELIPESFGTTEFYDYDYISVSKRHLKIKLTQTIWSKQSCYSFKHQDSYIGFNDAMQNAIRLINHHKSLLDCLTFMKTVFDAMDEEDFLKLLKRTEHLLPSLTTIFNRPVILK